MIEMLLGYYTKLLKNQRQMAEDEKGGGVVSQYDPDLLKTHPRLDSSNMLLRHILLEGMVQMDVAVGFCFNNYLHSSCVGNVVASLEESTR